MLSRKITNFIRAILDEGLPPFIRDNRILMYPLFYIWFKGKNVRRFMEFKSVFHNLSEEEFSKYYEDYDYIAVRETDLSNNSIDFIIKSLGDNKQVSIADIGCGSGYVLKQISDHGFTNLLGVDLVARSNYENIPTTTGNIEALPFPDNHFDIVICSHTLEHVLDLPKAISELKRVAKHKLIVTVPRQRYYRYTFDLHIHFFPQISFLLKYLDVPESQVEYKNIKTDWTVVCNFKS